MPDQSTLYPNLSWDLFAIFNDNATGSFEDMCRDLFYCEYLHENRNPHSDHNNPGVEVLPILEPKRDDGEPQKLISFQAKYFKRSINNNQIKESLKQAVKHYKGQLGRIYLFCNIVISKDSDRFRQFHAVLKPANIELELVTDRDIFTLLRKHKRVADYYFQDRKRATMGASDLMKSTAIVSSVSEFAPNQQQVFQNPILQNLLKSEIQKCKEAILDLNFGVLKTQLNLLNVAADTEKMIAYYQLLLAAHDREDFEILIKDVPDELKEQAFWLKSFCRNPRDISFDEIRDFSPETQVVTLVILFAEQRWENILDLYIFRDSAASDILKAFDYHYALALFNLREEGKAHEVLSVLFEKYHEPRFELYSVCAQLNQTNRSFVFGNAEQTCLVKDLLEDLDRAKLHAIDQLKNNGNLIATIELQSCFNLGATEKTYIDEAITRYNGYPEEVRRFDGVRLFMALCYEIGGDLEKAIELLSQCGWRDEEAIAARYITALIDFKQYDTAIRCFDEIKIKTPRTESVYFLALSRVNDEKYENKLKKAVDDHRCSFEDLLLYGFYIEDQEIFRRIIVPELEELLSGDLNNVELQVKIGLLAILAKNGELELTATLLSSIPNVDAINSFVAHDIYRGLFNAVNKDNRATRKKDYDDNELFIIERIANRFYEAEIYKRDFLQIKLMCASAANMEFSMLKYSKELFEYTHDVQTAKNIIALLYKRNETRKEEYEPYLVPLTETEDPRILMAASSALWKLGKYDDADFYAYKALYNLNGKDDFEVYKSLFGYHNLNLQRNKDLPVRKSITGNMIVSLKSGDDLWEIALDSESDFGDSNNHSLEVEHISKQDPIYSKLIGAGIRQVLNLRGKNYQVISFEPREVAMGRFIFKKVSEYPDKFNVYTISIEDTEEMVKQMLALSDQREHTQKLLELYNFKDNQLGIPIDWFAQGNYEKYIATMQYLLYTRDLAYYAGEPRLENVIKTKYIPTLSTFVLLALHEWLNVLDWLQGEIIIPESYLDFFKEQYAIELKTQAVSGGSLVPLDDGKFTIIENNKKLPEIWEKIIAKCELYSTVKVMDEERIAFKALENHSWERLFGKFNMDKMQLDGLLVAKREDGVYLCDDLFFRKIAEHNHIKHINFASILYANTDHAEVMPIILELSKTNYIYTPLRYSGEAEWKQLVDNLLDGEKKKAYYEDVLIAYFNAWDQYLREIFGESGKSDDNQDDEITT